MLGGTHHEVALVQAGGGGSHGRRPAPAAGVIEVSARPSPDLARLSFSCDAHRESAAVLEAIEEAYGDTGPDYLEVTDYHANGLVPLQARQAGHPLLRDTLVGVRLAATAELVSVHDGTLYQPGIELVAALEREQFRLADRLVWRGGDTLNLYRRHYADIDLPEAVFIPPPMGTSRVTPRGRAARRRSAPRDPLRRTVAAVQGRPRPGRSVPRPRRGQLAADDDRRRHRNGARRAVG
jgi:hypothetical protein